GRIQQEGDVDLRLFPANLSLATGAAAEAKVRAYRRDGFNGEISVAFEGLPAGFIAAPATIPAGQTEIRTTITAPPDAALGIVSPVVKGTAIIPQSGDPVAEKKAAEEALAKVKGELQAAVAEHEAAEKAPGEALAAVAPAQAAMAQAATTHTSAQAAAAPKRQQSNDAKKGVDDLVAAQQVPAEANAAAAAKAVTDSTAAKAALDQPLAEAKAADEAKAALTQAQANEQQAQSQSDAADAKLAEAEAQKKSADETLANVKTQVATATTAHQEAEKAAQEAEWAAANATLAEATKRIESLGNLAKTTISLKADPAPRGVTVKAANIAADQNEATVTLTVTKQAPVGVRQNIILSGTLRVGPETIIRVAPAIPINVLAAEQPKK
ncbi:MAG: hypothetical protein ABIP48_01295, partial [Planctomycetota bacterium]